MALTTKATGKKINSKATESKHGLMPHMMDSTRTAKSTVKDTSSGQMAAATKEISLKIISKVKEPTNGVIIVFIQAIGKKIRCRAEDLSLGLMGAATLETTSTTKRRAMGFSRGRTVVSTMANGPMVSKTVLEPSPLLQVRLSRENGKMEDV